MHSCGTAQSIGSIDRSRGERRKHARCVDACVVCWQQLAETFPSPDCLRFCSSAEAAANGFARVKETSAEGRSSSNVTGPRDWGGGVDRTIKNIGGGAIYRPSVLSHDNTQRG